MERRFEAFLNWIPFLKGNKRLQRLVKYVISAFAVYMLLKAPMMLALTELWHIHYVWSGFIAGAVVTLVSFLPFEFWAFKRRTE